MLPKEAVAACLNRLRTDMAALSRLDDMMLLCTTSLGLHSLSVHNRARPIMLSLRHNDAAAARTPTSSMYVARPFDFEECILEAKSEDEVQECMLQWDELREGEEKVVATAKMAMSASEAKLEECILNANNEDEVTACIRLMDEEGEQPASRLGECIHSGASIDECIVESDEASVHAFG